MSDAIPLLATARLRLRPFTLADAPVVREFAGDPRVAATTLNIPHPYPAGLAEQWIGSHADHAARGDLYVFAIERKADRLLLGAISLGIAAPHRRAELGYWLGVPFWNQGYTSEAAQRVVAFAFEQLQLNRVQATYLPGNPASGRVMEKAGLAREGTLRQYYRKANLPGEERFEDVILCALLRADYEARRRTDG